MQPVFPYLKPHEISTIALRKLTNFDWSAPKSAEGAAIRFVAVHALLIRSESNGPKISLKTDLVCERDAKRQLMKTFDRMQHSIVREHQ